MPIRVLYKKAGLPPTVKIISNTFKLKKTIVTKKLQIIPYQTIYIICHDKKKINYRNLNITYTLNSIYGDLILVNIDQKSREFKSLSQDEILWYTEDLIKNSPFTREELKINQVFNSSFNNFINTNEKFTNNFENKLISILTAIEQLLTNFKK